MFQCSISIWLIFFFFNDTATTEIYTLSLHDALPISNANTRPASDATGIPDGWQGLDAGPQSIKLFRDSILWAKRSEEHTSELQSQSNIVCRLLLEKKNNEPHEHNTM